MKLEKALKILGQDTVVEMEAFDKPTLIASIVDAESAMRQVQLELDNNEQYQELKESKKAMEAGKKEVDLRQKARIALALNLLEAKGT